uniref:uncharacterized protein n=1 Tax=Myxine glutinosa TaxID=7769 RepID=UPI00358FFF9B
MPISGVTTWDLSSIFKEDFVLQMKISLYNQRNEERFQCLPHLSALCVEALSCFSFGKCGKRFEFTLRGVVTVLHVHWPSSHPPDYLRPRIANITVFWCHLERARPASRSLGETWGWHTQNKGWNRSNVDRHIPPDLGTRSEIGRVLIGVLEPTTTHSNRRGNPTEVDPTNKAYRFKQRRERNMEWWMLITISTAFLLQCASLTLANNGSRNDKMNVIEGTRITIECLFEPESEKPSVIWLWEPETGDRREIFMDLGIPLDDLDRQFSGRLSCPGNFLAGNASLVISNITKQDSGTFFCQVQKYQDILFHSVVLNVTKGTRGVPQSPGQYLIKILNFKPKVSPHAPSTLIIVLPSSSCHLPLTFLHSYIFIQSQ